MNVNNLEEKQLIDQRRTSLHKTIERITNRNAEEIFAGIPDPSLIHLSRMVASTSLKRFCVTLSQEYLFEFKHEQEEILSSLPLESQKFFSDQYLTILNMANLLTFDPITGAIRKDFIDQHFALLHELSKEKPLKVAVVIIDVNDFKLVNDKSEEKHEAGDRCLASIGEALIKWSRDIDHLFRSGGDEFTYVSSTTNDYTDPKSFLRRLEMVCNKAFRKPGLLSKADQKQIIAACTPQKPSRIFTVSTGMAIYDGTTVTTYAIGGKPQVETINPCPGMLRKSLTVLADKRMYERKAHIKCR